MPFIQNASLQDVRDGNHWDAGDGGILIQIVDPDMEFPVPKKLFDEVYRFKFLDLDVPGPQAISRDQANEIAKVVASAVKRDRNVIVHCHAGVCRSGAVAEFGCTLGMEDTMRFRAPNLLVKKMLFDTIHRGIIDLDDL